MHAATIDGVAERFGNHHELRQVPIELLRWLVEIARKAGVERLVNNGGFTTDIAEPEDVDCVLLGMAVFPKIAKLNRTMGRLTIP